MQYIEDRERHGHKHVKHPPKKANHIHDYQPHHLHDNAPLVEVKKEDYPSPVSGIGTWYYVRCIHCGKEKWHWKGLTFDEYNDLIRKMRTFPGGLVE